MLDSVRFRLTLWYTAALALIVCVLCVVSYFGYWRNTLERADGNLAELSDAFVTTFQAELGGHTDLNSIKEAARVAILEHRFSDHIFAVLDSSNNIVISSADFPTAPAPDNEEPSVAEVFHSPSFQTFKEVANSGDRLYRNVTGGAKAGYRGFARHIFINGQKWTVITLRSLHAQKEMLEDVVSTFAWIIPIGLLLASAGGYFLARKSLAPVAGMASQAGRIGAENLHERLNVQNPRDELGRLALSFNSLLDRLDQSFERQRRFMADASHELRTPVAILRGEAEVALSRPNRPPDEYRESLAVLREEAQRLTQIVDDLFTLARADAGQYPLTPRDFYLEELVADCLRTTRTLALAKHITISGDCSEELPICADEGLIRRMLLNLLDNAIKYTPPSGTVSVSCTQSKNEYCLSVSDSGLGIPEDLQDRIFERFFRVDEARSRGENNNGMGAGLGLSIARWIAEAHHGRLELTRSGPTGTTFTARLPVTISTASGHPAEYTPVVNP
ncbi:MAG TPA: ATP-binding protein [Candidatus Dormibacteraeota bacterium]|nr:ATP-binding protein [Candidatus Dormibacteraeota bacterium]